PSDLAALLAIRMQQILREEHGFFQSADPLGGSYLVESLTFRCEADILKALQEIEARGGAIACIRNGFTRSIIADGAIRRQQRTNEGARVMVGVNKYRSTESEPQASAYRPDEDAEAIQRDRLAKLRAERDAARVRQALEDVRDAARGKDNLVPPVLEAVKAEATLGEICDVLRDVFGEFEPDTSY
ncbi:MAG TPA: methylmalonyl-CoA mutase family protein, partial [Limnochordales bacterium]